MLEIQICEKDAGQRLDKYLHKLLKEAPDSFIHKMLRKKNITLNCSKASGKELLQKGDTLKLFLSGETIAKFKGSMKAQSSEYKNAYKKYGEPDIVYENKHVLIVNKPAGILAQKAAPEDLSLNEWFIGYLLEKGSLSMQELQTFIPSVCNRLDRNTSGMVICSKTLYGSQKMSGLLKDRSLHKYYRLFVKGTIRESSHLKGYLIKDEITNTVRLSEKKEAASYIETKYQPVKNYANMTLLEAELITGKTHQIRLHLSSTGHPILGDYKYGDWEFNDSYKKKYHINYQLLHAYRLKFPEINKENELQDMSGLVLTAKEPEIFHILDKNNR